MPLQKIRLWLEKEKELGSPNPNNIVLATSTSQNIPHSRIVAIREITPEGVLFFTQRESRKVRELTENPHASMTLWLPLQQREVIIEGTIKTLDLTENEDYWKAIPRDRQLRFTTFGPTSGQPITSLAELEEKQKSLLQQFDGKDIPIPHSYCGFRLIPETFYFYTLGSTTFSEVIKYTLIQSNWQQQLLSP